MNLWYDQVCSNHRAAIHGSTYTVFSFYFYLLSQYISKSGVTYMWEFSMKCLWIFILYTFVGKVCSAVKTRFVKKTCKSLVAGQKWPCIKSSDLWPFMWGKKKTGTFTIVAFQIIIWQNIKMGSSHMATWFWPNLDLTQFPSLHPISAWRGKGFEHKSTFFPPILLIFLSNVLHLR